jgi:hypothetical protein
MAPGLRRFALTAHVVSSVGWLGSVAVFTALGILGMTSQDNEVVRAAYLVMEPTAWFALIPLAVASLVTGLIQSLGTTWGLVRHYWVLFKLVINVAAVAVLLMYTQTLASLADMARNPAFSAADLGPERASPTIHSVLALALLVGATVLAIYKPRGMTAYGQRRQEAERLSKRPVKADALAQ